MDDQAAQEEIQHLRQEIQDIDGELARLRAERRLFGRSSFSTEWLVLRQRSLQMERERAQSRLRELARAGHALARQRGRAGQTQPGLKTTVYALSGIVLLLVVMAAYIALGRGRAAVPAVSFAPTPTTPTATAIPSPTASPTPAVTIYKVVPGDTLSKISQQYGVTIEAMVQANKLQDPRMLSIGQELIIPPTPTPTSTATPSPRP
ncbi:MAG: LysM peptidoglycan-binding domain-containing protein [Dehalococcoidia bacterium]|nr:LysM peptidoglycan-binding domain-containing protein [Dehalococcoidia bacterium]